MKLSDSIVSHFAEIKDPRIHNHNYRHRLSDILIIALLGTICGADSWVEIERFGQAKEEWLRTFLELPNGIPSHDTLGRVFSLLDPKGFEACFAHWVKSLSLDLTRDIIALDGKTVRGSGNNHQGVPALHLVSAWATQNRLMLAQVKTEDKSNEITAIPKLLKMLDITGSLITMDAMGCQTNIARLIKAQGADYVCCLKKNQKTLFHHVKRLFDQAEAHQDIRHRRTIEEIKDHGRVETRRYSLLSARDPLVCELRWPGLQGIGKLEVVRTTSHHVERSTRYFITSLPDEEIDLFMKAVRNHWKIEIDLHWSLDVSFREDLSQVRIGHAAHNLSFIRRMALNLLKQEKTHKNGLTCRRKTAGWDHHYLLKVLQADRDRVQLPA